jgi:5-methylcytosine-specific restriction endonuclease McrA
MKFTSSFFDNCSIKKIEHVSRLSELINQYPYRRKNNNFKRLKNFLKIGTQCKFCGKQGKFIVTINENETNYYTIVFDKDFIPITIDHIKPKSKGGSNKVDNLQPLCYYCNNLKSDMTNDNLVTIKKIKSIKQIPEAEHIELICVSGYTTYAEKSKYKVGDYVIFIKPDSWIPNELVPAPFIPKMNLGVYGWRLKKKKIMGIPVRGMVLPLSLLDGIDYKNKNLASLLSITPYVIAKRSLHVDSINSRHKKIKEKIFNTFSEEIYHVLLNYLH